MNRHLPIVITIASRNITRNARRSLFTVMAIAFGLFCLIVFQALKNGLHREMVAGTVRLDTGSLQIHAAGFEANLASLKPISDPEKVAAALQQAGIYSFARRIRTPGLVLSGPASSSVLLYGIDPTREKLVTTIYSNVIAGTYPAGPDKGILIGEDLARTHKVAIGSRMTLMAQGAFGRPSFKSFTVSGIFRTKLASFDRSRIYLDLADLQDFLGGEGAVTEYVAVVPLEKEHEAVTRLQRLLPADTFKVQAWQELTPDLTQLIELNDATMRLLILIVFFIVALGITNTMSMAIFERIHELGILAAIGTTPARIIGMIIAETCLIGIFAALIGTIAGSIACLWLSRYGIDLSRFTSNNQYFAMTHILKAHLTLFDLFVANATTLATALLASIYPALKGARLNPVEAMRHT